MDEALSRSSAAVPMQGPRGLAGLFPSGADWSYLASCVQGPLVTLGAAVLLDVLRRHDMAISPLPVLLLTVVYAAYRAGLRPALVSAAITLLYALNYFALPGQPLHYTPNGGASLLALAGSALITAALVSRLHASVRAARPAELERAEAAGLARRFGLLEQSALALAAPGEPDAALREFARLLVPLLADWCTLHVAPQDEPLRFVAGVHRDPSRDLVVRALAEYGDRRLPFGPPPESPERIEVTQPLLEAASADAEARKLYRALAPAEVVRLPFHSGPRLSGVLTLVVDAESGRRFTPADVLLAEELADTASLAVENASLRAQANELLRRARLVFEANPQPMWIFDVDTLAFLAVNEATVRHYGYSRDELLGMTILDLLAPDAAAPFQSADWGPVRGGTALAHHQRRDGTVVEMELASQELEVDGRHARLVLATDITERARARAALHQAEDQLRQAHRAEALGRVAGAVAHDFNNLLTTIRGFGEILMRDFPADDRRRQDAERIRAAADRGVLLTRQLLGFGRNRPQEPRPVQVNQVVRELEPLVRRLLGADVELEVRLDERTGEVLIDPAQLEHAVVHLVLSAKDAMPGAGRLTIETGERRISEASRGQPVRAGRYVVVAIGDSATEEADAARSSVGRSVVYGIVRQYGGVVRVASEAGQGTTVKIYLPRLRPDEDAGSGAPPDGEWHGSETVLVAEDEDGVRHFIRQVLTDFGYTVIAARHGEDALLMAESHEGTVDLLVTDVVMPGMSGRELAERLRASRPVLEVLFVSGYADDEILGRGISGQEVPFLRKPFSREELARCVRELLDRAPA